jgi:hypothetical protein
MAPTPSTGTSVILENRNLLSIPSDIPDASSVPTGRRVGHPTRDKSASISVSRLGFHDTNTPSAHSRHLSSQQLGLPEMIARGLLDRGESLGLNKTLMNAVTEFKVNLPTWCQLHLLTALTAEHTRYCCLSGTCTLAAKLLHFAICVPVGRRASRRATALGTTHSS